MKWKRMLLILTVFFICSSPSPYNVVEIEKSKWLGLFPAWEQMSQDQQDQIRRIYELSSHKHTWFPDSFPTPAHTYSITPKKLMDEKIKRLLSEET